MASSLRSSRHLTALQEIILELANEQEADSAIELIAKRSLELLSCDGVSIYLYNEQNQKLCFKIAKSFSLKCDSTFKNTEIDKNALASKSFKEGKILLENHQLDKKPNAFEKKYKYRNKSTLCIPLKSNSKSYGVLQLINKKNSVEAPWPSQDLKALQKMPEFNQEDIEIAHSLSAVAVSAIKKTKLLEHIDKILESFVRAATTAIDSRDSGTKGHSERVGKMTRALARAISEDTNFPKIKFNSTQLKQIEYAAILHDFGKIAVSENTLSKSQKLNSIQQLQIKNRIDLHNRLLETKSLQKLIDKSLLDNKVISEIDLHKNKKEVQEKQKVFNDLWMQIQKLSLPSITRENLTKEINKIQKIKLLALNEEEVDLLNQEEIEVLKISRGCLNETERKEIESHVSHSYYFLKQIPWTDDLALIPQIAYTHHESLDGKGYPRQLKEKDIPIETLILSICDIFDALSAHGRAYKKAIAVPKTLEIMQEMVDRKKLKQEFFNVFVSQKIWLLAEYNYPQANSVAKKQKIA